MAIHALPSPSTIDKILTGEHLTPLVSKYKAFFDHKIDGIEAIWIGCGIQSLQKAIDNKKIYRLEKTKIPLWVYRIFDWMGVGAVGKAERELDRVIKTFFDKAVRDENLKSTVDMFLRYIPRSFDIHKYLNHPIIKSLGEKRITDLKRTKLSYDLSVANKICDGEPLAPLVPKFKANFDLLDSIELISYRIVDLQDAIKAKKIYRQEKTKIPTWVYSVVDWMGWGAVGKAERVIDQIIKKVFDRAIKENVNEVELNNFLSRTETIYLQKQSNHPLMKREELKPTLQLKGIIKSDLDTYFLRKEPLAEKQLSELETQLLKMTQGVYCLVREIQLELPQEPGQKYNLLQLAIKMHHDEILNYLIDTVLKNSDYVSTYQILTQKTKNMGNAIDMLAKREKLSIKEPAIEFEYHSECKGAIKPKIFVIETQNVTLLKLMALYNACSRRHDKGKQQVFYTSQPIKKCIMVPDIYPNFLKQFPYFADPADYTSIKVPDSKNIAATPLTSVETIYL